MANQPGLSMQQQYRDAGSLLASWSRITLFTHERPDGDALGCLLGLARLLERAGKETLAVLFDEPPPRYRFLTAPSPLKIWAHVADQIHSGWADGMIIADTCAWQQLTPLHALLENRRIPLLAIDHHVTRDVVADRFVIDENASSTALLVAELAEALNWPLDGQTAEALFVGMATDTGWFRFSSTNAPTLEVAARLLRHGLKPDVLYERLFLGDSPARLKLLGLMLGRLELLAQHRLAVATITPDMLAESGATLAETEDLVNEPMKIGSVECSMLLTATAGEVVKVSLRSKHKLDCATLAASLGGGGHPRAAGVRLRGTLEAARDRVQSAVLAALRDCDPSDAPSVGADNT